MEKLYVMLFLSMMIANIKAGEPIHKKFNYGGFFSGLAAGYALPVFAAGYIITPTKEDLATFSCHNLRLPKRDIFVGRTIQGVGVGLVLIPLLINNRQLLMDKVSKYYSQQE